MISTTLFPKSALPPPHLLLFELLVSSATIGLTSPSSLIRPATIPVLSTCVYAITQTSSQYMRPRWAALLGGFSFTVLLQYIDLAIVSRRSFTSAKPDDIQSQQTVWQRWKQGWNALWSFRHLDAASEAKNVPHFDASNPHYVPSRSTFVARNALSAAACYLVLDLLAQRKPPSNSRDLFHSSLVPFFARLGSITAPQIKLRFLSIAGFAVTFYCIIQGFTALSASLAVGSGLSDVRSWRPAFGSVGDAYSLKNMWGKFWHQLLRKPLSNISSSIVYDVAKLPRGSAVAGGLTVVGSFALSGALHTVAGVSSGMPMSELGVFRFFVTQAFGLLLEQSVVSLYRSWRDVQKEERRERPNLTWRILGFVWVAAFMAWSGPAWLYPQAYRQSAEGSASILPFSMVRWYRALVE